MEDREKTIREAKDLKEQILAGRDMDTVEAGIMDNKLEFYINEVSYRITKPTFGQKQELNKAKIKKFNELIKDPDNLLREDLKKQYLLRGINIDELEQKNFSLEVNKKNLKEKLGELLTRQVSESDYKDLKKQIQDIEEKQIEINAKVSELLDFCIEQQLFIFSYSYLIMLIVEVKKDDKWVRLWKNYEEFSNTEETLVNQIAFYAALIIKDEVK